MTDSVLDKYVPGRKSGGNGGDGIVTDEQEVEDLGAFGWLRGSRERAVMLELRKRDGNIIAIGYNWLERVEFDPSSGITLHAIGRAFRIKGRNLNAEFRPQLRLFQGITRHRVPWIQEADLSISIQSNNDATIIESIDEYAYDAASHVTRTSVRDGYMTANTNSGTVLTDSVEAFDEGGFNKQSIQRTAANTNGTGDVIVQRKFDWTGNLTEIRTKGDSTVNDGVVIDRVITNAYDGANRVHVVQDSQNGVTTFTRDGRGNVLNQAVQLDSNTSNTADTTMVYDGLGRAKRVTDPPDAGGARHYRERQYDSRGNLLAEVFLDSGGAAKMALGYAYDNASRRTHSVTFADASASTNATSASASIDRVEIDDLDTDGRLVHHTTYNANSSTPHVATTTYDNLGRHNRTTDASSNYTDDDYATNGLRSALNVFDGIGVVTTTFDYDGHDRVITQTEAGTPNLVTAFKYDGLNRTVSITSPRGIVTTMLYDLIGRNTQVKEDSGGALERETDYAYNTLNQLITQTAKNSDASTNLPDQITRFRYDTLNRPVRMTYPDATDVSTNCTDCVKTHYDFAGRADTITNQRALTTAMVYDKRRLLLTRTTNSDKDSFGYDPLGRLTTANRGTTSNATAISHATFAFNDLGDQNTNTQQLLGGASTLTTTFAYDQAGNRLSIKYPSGVSVAYTSTPSNQVSTIRLNGSALVNYEYANTNGLALSARSITAPGGSYGYQPEYDSHHRVNSIGNSFTPNGGSASNIATYVFDRNTDGDITQQTASGISPFASDDRTLTVDGLRRLTDSAYTTLSGTESIILDRVGNRESYTPRIGSSTTYTLGSAANEYGTIGGQSLQYDANGNLSVDDAGRQYIYDERDRVTFIKDAGSNTLASFAYDGLGRRIVFADPVAGVTVHYLYDGPNIIEECNTSDVRQRYHVHGGQYIDEHVATYSDASSSFAYYLHNDLYTVAAVGNASGMVQESYEYSAYGLSSRTSMSCLPGDLNTSGGVTVADIPQFITVLLDGTTNASEQCAADLNGDGMVDGIDIQIFENCLLGGSCPGTHSGVGLRTPYTMHGAPVCILSDGLILQHNGARDYSVLNGRWLQRDPKGYVNGGNLYQAFNGNPSANADPTGEEVWVTTRRYKTQVQGRDVWAVDYNIHENGVGLGLGGQIFRLWNGAFGNVADEDIAENTFAGTEYFAYTNNPRTLRDLESSVASGAEILQDQYVATRDVANLRQGIIVLGTTAVALPVATVAVPLGTATFGTGVIGTVTTGVLTGGISAGLGSAAGHALVGDSGRQIAVAAGKGFIQGAPLGGIFGLAGYYNFNLTGPNAFQFINPALAEASASNAPLGSSSRLAPGGGLLASENAGGHLLARHVGQSELALATRIGSQSGIRAASTFLTRAEAEAGVAAAFDSNARQVAQWIGAGAQGRLELNGPFSGGMVLKRGVSITVQGTGARVIGHNTLRQTAEWKPHF